MKKRNKRSMAKVLLVQAIIFALTALILIFSMHVFVTALQLVGISDNIRFIEEGGRWTESAHERYDELIADRVAIKNSGLIGYVMVMLGSNTLLQGLRIIILIGVFVLDCFALYICYDIIRAHIKHIFKKNPKRKR